MIYVNFSFRPFNHPNNLIPSTLSHFSNFLDSQPKPPLSALFRPISIPLINATALKENLNQINQKSSGPPTKPSINSPTLFLYSYLQSTSLQKLCCADFF